MTSHSWFSTWTSWARRGPSANSLMIRRWWMMSGSCQRLYRWPSAQLGWCVSPSRSCQLDSRLRRCHFGRIRSRNSCFSFQPCFLASKSQPFILRTRELFSLFGTEVPRRRMKRQPSSQDLRYSSAPWQSATKTPNHRRPKDSLLEIAATHDDAADDSNVKAGFLSDSAVPTFASCQ